jgi:DNA polymerase (family 10)
MKQKVYRPIADGTPVLVKIKTAFEQKRRWKWMICGSIRRGAKQFGDIDVVTEMPLPDVIKRFESIPGAVLKEVETSRKSMSIFIDGIQVDIYKATVQDWGAMTLFLTGSAFLNILMRAKAKKLGYKLNQYGVWMGDELIAGRDEEQIFYALGLKYLKPEERSLTPADKGKKILVEEK